VAMQGHHVVAHQPAIRMKTNWIPRRRGRSGCVFGDYGAACSFLRAREIPW
jgi:hypothetical protein